MRRLNNEAQTVQVGLMVIAIVVIIALTMVALSIVAVDAGHVGIHDLWGNVDDTEMQPGLQLKHPFASVTKMSVKTQEYTMTYTHGEGAKKGSDVITALTQEGLTVGFDITVWHKLNPSEASDVYQTIGINYVDVIVRPQVRTVIRDVVARYEAKQLYSEDRETVALEIAKSLEPELATRGIILERVLLRNIHLPEQLTTSIEAKLVAEQDAERMQFVLQKEEQEAQRKVIEARGIKNSTTIVQEGLSRSPEYLTYLWLQKLENHESVVYVVEGSLGIPTFTKEIR